MIDKIDTTYEVDGVQVIQRIVADGENLPYDLAAMIKRVINDSCANPEIVIQELVDEFGYEKQMDGVIIPDDKYQELLRCSRYVNTYCKTETCPECGELVTKGDDCINCKRLEECTF